MSDIGKGIAILGIWIGAGIMSFAVVYASPLVIMVVAIMAMVSTFIVSAMF